MNVIDMRDITLRRGDRCILQNVSWRIGHGEHWALLGANGSGKTTLLSVLTGYQWPTEGHVAVSGKRYGECDLREHRKSIGWVGHGLEQKVRGEDTALETTASGLDSTFGLYRELDAASQRRCEDALTLAGGAAFAAQRFATLSQGEQQRTIIARALVNRPAVLVLDEPCAGLDPASRSAFLEDLRGLAGSRHAPTMVLVTHHVEEIGPWLTHALVLKDGRVLSAGRIDAVLTSEVLSEAFSRPCEVIREDGHYRMSLWSDNDARYRASPDA